MAARTRLAPIDFATRWRTAGSALERLRREDLRTLRSQSARRITGDLFALWTPDHGGDDGESLLRMQRRFRSLYPRPR